MATLDYKTILIFGGSSGIGYSVAEASLASGAACVTIASSNASKITEAVKRLQLSRRRSGKIQGEVVDGTDSQTLKDLLVRIGEIDHLVWTSGDTPKLQFLVDDLDSSKHIFDVRFWAPILAAQSAKIRMGGSITITVGAVIVKPPKGWSIAAGVNGATDALSRGLAVDLAPVRVNVVCPGTVNTEIWKEIPPPQKEKMFSEAGEKLLVKRVAEPAEIAEAYLFLMKCAYITGQKIEVDGGYALGA